MHASPPTPRRSRGRPRNDEIPAIEEVLLGAALDEFVAHGYGGASLARIVGNAGVSKTTLWSRYAGKEALFTAIMKRQIERTDGAAMLLTSNGGQPALARGLARYANHMLAVSLEGEMADVNRLIASESVRFPELGVAAVQRTMIGVGQIADFISHCTRADPIPCRNPESVAEIFIGALRGWHSTTIIACRKPSRKRREAFVERLVELLLAARGTW